MTRIQKNLTTVSWGLLVVVMIVVLAGWNRVRGDRDAASNETPEASTQPLPKLFPVPDFSLTDQQSQTFGLSDLKGRPWVATFIFTRCAGPCPMIARKMASLQTAMPDPRITLVSFSVDPTYDTPAILKTYADQFGGADPKRWHLLTGDRKIIQTVGAGMKLATQGDQPENITHSDRFVLVDAEGWVRGYYSVGDDLSMAKLQTDAAALASGAAK